MSVLIKDFDPLSLLDPDEIKNFTPEQKDQLRQMLQQKIEEYIIIKLSQELDQDQLDKLLNSVSSTQKYQLLNQYFVNINDRINLLVEDFRKEFKVHE